MGAHYWDYCDHCQTDMVVCGECGNNCCNGGRGETFGPFPGVLVPCKACDSAYAMQNKGKLTAPTGKAGGENKP